MTEELRRGNVDRMWIVTDEVYFKIYISLRKLIGQCTWKLHHVNSFQIQSLCQPTENFQDFQDFLD